MFELNNDWNDLLKDEFSKEYFLKIKSFLEKEYKENTIYPAKENIFNALNMSSFKDTKVVILGQDPYHEPGQAHGLAFSVLSWIKLPPSLINIYKELYNEYNLPISDSGNLTPWAKQGVLLLNNVLTVRKGEANSHKGLGWEIFTDSVANGKFK